MYNSYTGLVFGCCTALAVTTFSMLYLINKHSEDEKDKNNQTYCNKNDTGRYCDRKNKDFISNIIINNESDQQFTDESEEFNKSFKDKSWGQFSNIELSR